jgi:transcriptional regulator
MWLRDFVEGLTNRFEAGRADPWKITDAPDDYIEQMLSAIIGLEIPVTRLLGKWKVSQNRVPADREAVARGFKDAGDAVMAGWVQAALDAQQRK